MQPITMKDVRLETRLYFAVICSERQISQERKGEITCLQIELQRQICLDLRITEAPGCLAGVSDNTVLSPGAGDVLKKLAAALATA